MVIKTKVRKWLQNGFIVLTETFQGTVYNKALVMGKKIPHKTVNYIYKDQNN